MSAKVDKHNSSDMILWSEGEFPPERKAPSGADTVTPAGEILRDQIP